MSSGLLKHAFLKQYEKFSCFLRNELCSNNLRDFGLKKGLDHLDLVRKRFQTITDRFAGFQAQSLNVHVISLFSSASPCPSPPAQSATPASKSMTPGSSACSKSYCITVRPLAAGLPNRFTRRSSPPSDAARFYGFNCNSATISANSKVTDYSNAMDDDMPTADR